MNENIDETAECSYDDTPRVNLDLKITDRNLSPEKIATLFIEIAQRADKCFSFEVSEWLEVYEKFRIHPNFAEAALVIASAASIYARKVDYLEGLVHQMCDSKNEKVGAGEQDQTKMVRRGRGKKFRPTTITSDFSDVEFIVKEVTTLPKTKLTEIVQKKKTDFGSHWEKFKASQCKFLKNKKNKLVVSKKMTEATSDLISANATFGKSHIYDYEQEEIIGTKSDFRCFSNIIDESAELLPDYNFQKYFRHVDAVDRDLEKRQCLQALGIPGGEESTYDLGPRKFQVYMPPEYMKNTYNIDFSEQNHQKFKRNALNMIESEPSIQLQPEITEFSDLPKAKEAAESLPPPALPPPSPPSDKPQDLQSTADSGFQSTCITSDHSTLESIPEEAEEFFDAVAELQDSGINLSLNDSNKTIASDLVSIDEGIQSRIESPCWMSEIDGNPPYEVHSPLFGWNALEKRNLFEIDEAYLKHQEDFDIPLEIMVQKVKLESNIFMIPEAKMRRKCIFSLPPDEFNMKPKPIILKMAEEPKNPRVFKPLKASNDPILTVNENSQSEDEFLGFPDNLPQSTPIKPAEEPAINPPESPSKRKPDTELQNDPKRLSFDSIMTDDEDIPSSLPQETLENSTKNDEKTSTPEKIKGSPRMSRDSGIKSPSPPLLDDQTDETLIVTIEEPQEGGGGRREAEEDASSSHSFQTADNGGAQTTQFSFHDKELILQAQNKYQEQVSEMQQLVEKVNRWHQHLKPILRDSQERGHFEIHEYGTRVLDSFTPEASLGTSITFADVMHTKPKDSIARYFLSTLMLVNSGNVEMTVDEGSNGDPLRVLDPSEINLKLTSRVRVHETIDNLDETVPCFSSGSSSKKRKNIEKASSASKRRC